MTRTSPEKVRANRANATKSTGPKSAAGKARSGCNALKHGLAATTVVAWDDREAVAERVAAYAEALRPANRVEADLVARAALAAVRLDRCARHEQAAIGDAIADAVYLDDRQQAADVERLAAAWPTDPAGSVGRLRRSAAGCEWLLGRWAALISTLDSGATWSGDEVVQAVRLLGRADLPTAASTPPLAALWLGWISTEEGVDLDDLDRYFGESTADRSDADRLAAAGDRLPEPDEALAMIRSIIDDERAALKAARDDLRRAVDAPKRALAVDRALFDASDVGVLRRRYESAGTLDLHRSLNQLSKIRKERLLAPDDAVSDASHVPESSPIVARPNEAKPDASPSDGTDSADNLVPIPAVVIAARPREERSGRAAGREARRPRPAAAMTSAVVAIPAELAASASLRIAPEGVGDGPWPALAAIAGPIGVSSPDAGLSARTAEPDPWPSSIVPEAWSPGLMVELPSAAV